jgi:ketosteroid isomerase-like protein
MDRIAKYRRDLLMAADQTTTDPHWPVFINKLEAAEIQFAPGRPAAFKALWSRGDDVSLYGAFGGVVSGWKEVETRLDWASSQYLEGKRGREEISRFVGVDVAYIVQTEWIRARIARSAEPSLQELRVTMVFRREGDDWRIVHRHADPLLRTQTS